MKVKGFKVLSLIIIAVFMLTTLLTGCGSTNDGSKGTQANTQETTKATTQADTKNELAPVTLNWYVDGTPQSDVESVLAEVNKKLKDKINATLNLNIIDWGSYDSKMQILIASGEDVDLCFTSTWANNITSMASKGAYAELDDLLKKYGQNILKQVPAKYIDMCRIKGKLYAIPNYQIEVEAKGIDARKDLVDKYKINTNNIKGYEGFVSALETIKANESGITPYFNLNASVGLLAPKDTITGEWISEAVDGLDGSGVFAISHTSKDYKVYNTIDSGDVLYSANFSKMLVDKGLMRKDNGTLKDYKAEFKTGKYFAFDNGTCKPGNEIETKGWSGGIDVVEIRANPSKARTNSVLATTTAITKTSKNPERAMMLLDLTNSDKEIYNLLSHGIENKHYKKVDDQTVEAIANSGYDPNIDWEFGVQFNGFLRKGQDKDTWAQTIKMNEEAQVTIIPGFNPVFDNIKTEWAQIQSISKQYSTILSSGVAHDVEDTVKKYSDQVKKAGGEKVMAELQKQLDTWRVENNIK